jgi:hypothetical protein
MHSKETILNEFELLHANADGIGSWLWNDADEAVFSALGKLDKETLSFVKLNQILTLAHEATVSQSFFNFYWLSTPDKHPYDVKSIPGFQSEWLGKDAIVSLEHLKWGLYRFFVDGLLYFGNIGKAFNALRASWAIDVFFRKFMFDTESLKKRGPSLDLVSIPKDNRYLISEMACKSYGETPSESGQLHDFLVDAYMSRGGGRVTIRELLSTTDQEPSMQNAFQLSLDDALDDWISSREELENTYEKLAKKFTLAREAALENTKLYLSMVSDMDVYVATSMRTRNDFREMGNICEKIFLSEKIKPLHLRYFDPTMSAANGHEDKGLIECLMVKCAKVLVYCAGERDSFGKDAEAAMALSLGKPVIFYCTEEKRQDFYQTVHPLSRIIRFDTGVAVGAMVTSNLDDVSELLCRIFENRMEYRIDQPKPQYLRLVETLTGSTVRIQTNDRFLTDVFWDQYQDIRY